jgi:hypothetical protein
MHQRIPADISVGIDAAPQPNRITLYITAQCLIVLAEAVLVQHRFFIEQLPGETLVIIKQIGL